VPQWKALLLTLLSPLFVAGGIWLLVENRSEDRALAIGMIAMFGAGLVVGIMHLFPILQTGKLRDYVMALCCASLGLACFLVAPLAQADGDMSAAYASWAGAVFFGLGAIVIAWRAGR
jgi:hypothetical protein